MTPPYLVTAPTSLPVPLAEMKAHLRVVHDEDDADIAARQAGVVALLDGWGGALGRCIMPQTWAVDVEGPGPHVLPFPDASDITSGALVVDVKRTYRGFEVTLPVEADEAATIQFECGMDAPRLEAAKALVKLMVERDFDQKAGPDYVAMSMTIDALINAMRWRRV
jgi:hypothetical protein